MYGVLKRKEILALIIDWGYRPDGVPVRLFGAWTTLPAGPAALAAKTGAPIVHIAIRRSDDRQGFVLTYGDPIIVASSDEAEIRRATQAIADALAATIAAAPEDWYSFKPLWPSTDEEKAALAARAAPRRIRADPARRAPARWRRPADDRLGWSRPAGRTFGSRLRARALVAASWLACRLPERPLLALADFAGALSYRLATERRRRARRNLLRIARWLAAHDLGPARRARGRVGPAGALAPRARRLPATPPATTSSSPGPRSSIGPTWIAGWSSRTPRRSTRSSPHPAAKLFVGMHLGWFELPALIAAYRSGRPAVVPSETLVGSGPPGLHGPDAPAAWASS